MIYLVEGDDAVSSKECKNADNKNWSSVKIEAGVVPQEKQTDTTSGCSNQTFPQKKHEVSYIIYN